MLDSTLDSQLPTRLCLRYYSKPKPLQVENNKAVSVALIFTSRGIFIGVQGGVTDLAESVTRQVVANQPSHVAGRSRSSASTDLPLGIPLYYLLESVIVKPTCERLQSGPASQGVWPAGHPLGPLVYDLCTLPPRIRYTLGVTLILVEF
jgi:hypothetical protein